MTRIPREPRRFAAALLFALLLIIPLAVIAFRPASDEPPVPQPGEPAAADHEPGEVVVRWTAEARDEALAELDLEVKEELAELGATLLAVPIGSEVEVAQALTAREGVAWAQPNFIRRISMIPNDPLFDRQWSLRKIDAPAAWEMTLGSPTIVVAVIDTGVDLAHPDLQARLVPGRNLLDSELPPQDDGGHGTHVAGTIAATINNNMGVAGVAPGVSIMPIKALRANGSGKDTTVAQGVMWAADNGARIINMSFGGAEVSRPLSEAISYAARKGIITVVAAGNEGIDTPSYPAATEPNIAVAATDQNDRRGPYSNFGTWIVISAPGTGIWSTWWGGQSSYRIDNGTSMAAPHVSGVIALMLSVRPDMTIPEITGILRSTADPVLEPGIGAGRINAGRAIAALKPIEPTATTRTTATVVPTRTATPVPTRGVTRASARSAFAMTYDVPTAGLTLYLPMVVREVDGWTSEVTIQSASEARGTVEVQFVRDDGTMDRVVRAAIGALGSLVVPLDSVDLPSGSWRGAAVVSADVRISAVVTMSAPTFDSMAYDARVESGSAVYTPLAFKNRNGWKSTVAVQNSSARPATVRLTYRSSTGDGQWSETIVVPPLASQSVALADRAIVPEGFAGGILLNSIAGEPLAVVLAATHSSGSATAYAGAVSGSTTLVAPMLFKNRATEGVWNTGIQLQNLGGEVAQVVTTYMSSESPGLEWSEGTTIAPGAAHTLYQASKTMLPDGFVGSAQITVINGVPITGVVNEVNYEREISSVYELLSVGETQRFVPRLLRAVDGRNTGLQVQNLGDGPAEIAITYRAPSGAVLARQEDVIGPRASQTYYQPSVPGLADGYAGGAVIESVNGQPIAAVVNEVRY
jgi:subtilisin family serine protease